MNSAQGYQYNTAGLFRRLFAIVYDCFLLLAIIFVTTAITTAVNGGKAIDTSDPIYPFFVTTVFALTYVYFAWFWIHGGQTLGMKTWRLKLMSNTAEPIGWKTSLLRYFAALISWGLFGLGFLWSLFSRDRRCWHDLASHTTLIDLRK